MEKVACKKKTHTQKNQSAIGIRITQQFCDICIVKTSVFVLKKYLNGSVEALDELLEEFPQNDCPSYLIGLVSFGRKIAVLAQFAWFIFANLWFFKCETCDRTAPVMYYVVVKS